MGRLAKEAFSVAVFLKKGLASIFILGGLGLAGFVFFQEWGNRKWPEADCVSEQKAPLVFKSSEKVSRSKKSSRSRTGERADLTVLYWNVRNYEVADSSSPVGEIQAVKSEKEIEGLVQVLLDHRADAVALVEVNSAAALADLRDRLKEKGLDYPYAEFLKRVSQHRGMALLSLLPFEQQNSIAEVPIRDAGHGVSHMMRGILSVQLKTPIGAVNVLTVHLKSKVGELPGEEGVLRRCEVAALLDEVQNLRKNSPGTPLILCGDFNDTPNSPVIKSILSDGVNSPELKKINAKDSRGEIWTHYYKAAASYTQLDYVFFYVPDNGQAKLFASILDQNVIKNVSDHRPLLIKLKE